MYRLRQSGTCLLAGALAFAALPGAAVELLPSQQPPEVWINQGWRTDFARATVEFAEIDTVIGADDIPAIDTPEFLPVSSETRIPDVEPVVALELGGDARAYPLRVMMWHEIVNDTVDGGAVAVTYCPLCNTSIVFDRVVDGEPVTFGTTGKLRFSDLVMYDRASHTWWQQFTGEAIVGEHAGETLEIVPSRLMSFALFAETWPDGLVLQPPPSRPGASGRNPYERYDSATAPFLFSGELPEDIAAMARVVLVQDADPPVAVALGVLRDNQPMRIGVYEFRWAPGQASALDQRQIADGRDVGNIEVVRFAGDGEEPAAHEVTFAFAARAFHPGLEIVQ